jgi:hypothetical protein
VWPAGGRKKEWAAQEPQQNSHQDEPMKIYLVSYATGRFIPEQECLMKSALQFGITDLRPWDEQMLRETAFYLKQRTILNARRGAGYWLWKPFIIHHVLKEMRDGDCLAYSDSGIEIIGDLTPLFEIAAEKEITVFSGHGRCRQWTKRDCFFYLGADQPAYHDAPMLEAGFLVLMKTRRACAFAENWLASCLDRRVLSDDPNTCGVPNLPEFVAHRHDQSVLSILAKRENLELFRSPTQYGNSDKLPEYREAGEWTSAPYGAHPFQNSPYGTLLDHHRGFPPAPIRRARQACQRFLQQRGLRPAKPGAE